MTNVITLPLSMIGRAVDRATSLLRTPQAQKDITNLRDSYREHFAHGLQLNRMSRECAERARECFETAERVKEQLGFYGAAL